MSNPPIPDSSLNLGTHPSTTIAFSNPSKEGDLYANMVANALTVDGSSDLPYDTLWLSQGDRLHAAWVATQDINDSAGKVANGGWEAIDHQFHQIVKPEFKELEAGIVTRDIHEFRDGMGDLLFTLVGLAHVAGVDLIADFEEVVASNQSKFDYSAHDAELTAAKYAALGVDTYQKTADLGDGVTEIITFVKTTTKGTDGKDYPADKWLKSHQWKDVQLSPLPADNQLGRVILTSAEKNAAETLVLAGPMEVVTNYLKNHHDLRIEFMAHLMMTARAVTSRFGAICPPRRKAADSASIIAAIVRFIDTWLYNGNETPVLSSDDEEYFEKAMTGIRCYEGDDQLRVNHQLRAMVENFGHQLSTPADARTFRRALEDLGTNAYTTLFHDALSGVLMDLFDATEVDNGVPAVATANVITSLWSGTTVPNDHRIERDLHTSCVLRTDIRYYKSAPDITALLVSSLLHI